MRHTRRPFWFYALLLLAILVRAAVPAGYMPDTKAGKPFTMVVCGLNGPQTVVVDLAFDPLAKTTQQDADHKATSSCEFAVLHHTPFLGAVADIVWNPTPSVVASTIHFYSQPVVTALVRNTSARGPPASS